MVIFRVIRILNTKVTVIEKTPVVEEYINKIRLYLKNIINNLKKSDTWKIQVTITINFISSKYDNDKERVMHWKGDNIEITVNDEADEVIKELFESLKKRYQEIFGTDKR